MMVLFLITACSTEEADTSGPPQDDATVEQDQDTPDVQDAQEEAPVLEGPATEVTIWFMGGSVVEDSDVIAAANARLQELGLNITVNPVWTGGWDMGAPGQIALDTGDTSVDIYWAGSWGLIYPFNARVGNFVRLDDPNNNLLATYGQGMIDAIPDFLWDAFTVDGPQGFGIYGFPGYKDFASTSTLDVNNTRLAELGIDFYDLFDMDGVNYEVIFDPLFEEAMHAAKEMWGPSFFPIAHDGGTWARMFSATDHDLTDTGLFHFTFDPRNPSQPADLLPGFSYQNERYMRVQERMHHFWEQGFIDPRAAIPGEATAAFLDQRNAGEYLFSNVVYAYGHTAQASSSRGIDARFPRVSDPLISTITATGSGFALSIYSRNQAAAVQFMNAWYTDRILADILAEGVEDTHFSRNADGTITRLEGGRDRYSPWRFGMGNIFVLSPLDIDGPDYFDRFYQYNAAGTPTTFIGFTFDNSEVLTELAALAAVRAEFIQVLNTGAVDPNVAYPQLIEASMANGLGRVQEELHRQLEEFFAQR